MKPGPRGDVPAGTRGIFLFLELPMLGFSAAAQEFLSSSFSRVLLLQTQLGNDERDCQEIAELS